MASPEVYQRFPSIHGDQVVFVTEDDLWSVSAGGGPARRLTADLLQVGRPSISPDGSLVAFTTNAEGERDAYVMEATGGPARRLTWLGEAAVAGWTPDGRVLVTSPAGQAFRQMTEPYAVSADPVPGGGWEHLPYGPVSAVAYGPGGAVAIGRNTGDPARWKRYRGGTAGAIWVDPEGSGEFRPLLEGFAGNLACPMWVGGRIWFLSDHEGIGNLYSCEPDGTGLRRHTDHDEHYARWASTDGTRIVYQVAARLWLHDPATGEGGRIGVEVGSPRTQRRGFFAEADRQLGGWSLDRTGDRLAVEVRGKLASLGTWEGPVRRHGEPQGVRYRLPAFAGDQAVVAVSDKGGEEGIELHPAGGEARRLEVPELGRVVELVPSPDGQRLAVTNHRNQLLLLEADGTSARVLDESAVGRPAEPAWSPDGAWLAYSYPVSQHTRQIRLAEAATGGVHPVSEPRFQDHCPAFDPGGRWLCFLSRRTFDPVYDNLVFDLGFPRGERPYLVTLHAEDPSPFLLKPQAPEPGGKGKEKPAGAQDEEQAEAEPVRIDLEGIGGRILAFPVPEGRYERLAMAPGKLLLLSRPVAGALSRDPFSSGPAPNGTVESYDLAEGKHEELVHEVIDLAVSGDGARMAYLVAGEEESRHLRVVEAGVKPAEDTEHDPPGRTSGWVDLGRVRPEVDPGAEWAQMLAEAWRLQREEFWVPDLSGVDWDRVLRRYLPLVELVSTRSELSDLMWEMQGELGTSHAYELGGDYRDPPKWHLGRLGADLSWDPGSARWRVSRVPSGSSWEPAEASPLAAPGVGVGAGAAVLAVDGQPVPAESGPGPLLANRAGQPVELTVEDPGGGGTRRVVAEMLGEERALWYRDWVEANRRRVHEATGGRVGYLHIPDMGPVGFAEFHRSYLSEVEREALVVDVRFNAGGHVSGLLLEKLARRRIGYDVSRWGPLYPYPAESVGGPMVCITNEWAGSDGDIFTHGFQLLGLGPVVGTRTWGGVIGIEPTQPLVDGSITTQPGYAYWFVDVGWAVENHGADPDHEVAIAPQDHAAGRDPQMDKALELVTKALAEHRPPKPDLETRPRLVLPDLPARA